MNATSWRAAFCAALACAAAQFSFAENLVLNGKFEADQVDVPTYWRGVDPAKAPNLMSCRPSGGPGGIPSVLFRNPDGGKLLSSTLRQYDITLVKGEKYRISAWVRTKGFRAKRWGVLVVNARWTSSAGISRVPQDSDWQRLSAEIEMFDSKDGFYSLTIFMQKFCGEIEFADVSLEPLSEKARAGSRPSRAATAMLLPRFFPWEPLLSEISPDTREATFRFCGEPPKGAAMGDFTASFSSDGKPGELKLPLAEFVKARLPAAFGDEGLLRVAVAGKDGAKLVENVYPYRVRKATAAVPAGAHRKLNNFVTEVLNAPVGSASAAFRFTTARAGWTFIRVEGGGKASASLDGKLVIDPSWCEAETFRNIAAGEHELAVSGAAGGRVVVRSIVETLNYPPCCDSHVKANPSYGWDFFTKHVMRSATTQNGGQIPKANQAEYFAHGGEWLSNFVEAKHAKTSIELPDLILKSPRFTPDCYQGTTVDEFFLGSADTIERYMDGLKIINATYPGEKRIYSWVIGKPGMDGLSREFLSTAANLSHGRGKLIFEVYCRTKPTEEAARAYLKDYFADTLDKCRKCFPHAERSVGLILGNFNQLPIICAVHHPDVDFKHYLDMQLNYLANDPAFEGLSCTGYWGSYYGDHEIHRWSMALLRHYCVEGRTDMLSEKYGFSYIPGHLLNGDFRGTFAPWTAKGDVTLDDVPGFAAHSQRRWGGTGGIGDTFAVLRRGEGAANSVSQRVKGLVPGRHYCLQAATFDAKDVRSGRVAPRRIPLEVTLSSEAEKVPSLSWVHEDKRTKLSAKSQGARINLHHIVFVARATEATVTVSDAAAKPGEELGVNCVSLNPFYPEAD